MSNTNVSVLTGNLVYAPELRYTPSGKAVCDTRIAVNTGFGDKPSTLFMSITVWGKQAESLVEYCGQGNKITATGRLEDCSWEDKEGKKHEKIRVVANSVEFLTFKDRGDQQGTSAAPPAQNHAQNTPPPSQQANSGGSSVADDDEPLF